MIRSNKIYKWFQYLQEILEIPEAEILDIEGFNLSHEDIKEFLDTFGLKELRVFEMSEIETILKENIEVVIVASFEDGNIIGKFYEVVKIKEDK